MPYRGGRRKKARTHRHLDDKRLHKTVPRSFVIRQGKVHRDVSQLIRDVRQLMLPWTAKNLRETKSNVVRDFVAVAGPLGMTHLLIFHQKSTQTFLKIAKLSHGPTLTFKLLAFSLMRDVRRQQKAPRTTASDYHKSPLLILNGFKKNIVKEEEENLPENASPESELEQRAADLLRQTFGSMFPSVDLNETRFTNATKRAVLFHNVGGGVVEMRHYAILKEIEGGVSKAVAMLFHRAHDHQTHRALDESVLSLIKQVKEVKKEPVDDSTVQSIPLNTITLDTQTLLGTKSVKREDGNAADADAKHHEVSVAVSLMELGPRLTLKLTDVKSGVCEGDVCLDIS